MHIVLVHFHDDDLVVRMRDMKAWLDAHGFEPSGLKSQRLGVVQVDFMVRREAEIFATRFAGRLISN